MRVVRAQAIPANFADQMPLFARIQLAPVQGGRFGFAGSAGLDALSLHVVGWVAGVKVFMRWGSISMVRA
jgi:hypothetical protein